jgi:hypothetical protein
VTRLILTYWEHNAWHKEVFHFFTQLRSSCSIRGSGTTGNFSCASICGVDHVCIPALSRTVAKRIDTPTGWALASLLLTVESTFERPLLCNFHFHTVKQATSPLRSRTAGQDPPFCQRSKAGSEQRSSCFIVTPLALPPHLAGTGSSSAFLSLSPLPSFSSLYV